MLQRTLIYVDTSYLLASFYNAWATGARAQLEIDLPEVVSVLEARAVNQLGQPVHRQNWYDGIPDSGPHRYQRALRSCPGVQLRTGQLIEWGDRRTQKAVDTRLVADMVLTSADREVTDIILVSGDADMLPGVEESVSRGVRVHLYGFGWDSMSSNLRYACDTTTILDPREHFAECMRLEVLEGPLKTNGTTAERHQKPIGDAEPVEDLSGASSVPDVRRSAGSESAGEDEGNGEDAVSVGADGPDGADGSDTANPSPVTPNAVPDNADTLDETCEDVQPLPAADAQPATPSPADVARSAGAAPGSDGAQRSHGDGGADGGDGADGANDGEGADGSNTADSTGADGTATEPGGTDSSGGTAPAEGTSPRPENTPENNTATPANVAAAAGAGTTRPSPAMMASRRKLRSRYVPLPTEIWQSGGQQNPFDIGEQYAIWWYHHATDENQRDNVHTLTGGGLPPEVDRPLLQFACETLHEYTLTENQRVNLRDGFHSGIRGILLKR
jgi:uncharacterized LabA/DUF88 family protein